MSRKYKIFYFVFTRIFYVTTLKFHLPCNVRQWKISNQYTPIRKNVDGDGFDLLTKRCNNTLTGRRSLPTRQTFSHYCQCLGMDLNPGHQSDVQNAKRSQFVKKNLILQAMCYVLSVLKL